MNLPQAMEEARAQSLALRAVVEQKRTEVGRRDKYKIAKYFHDCLPGCQPTSPNRADHVPLPGNELPTCRVLYDKSLKFFAAGQKHRERMFLAANRIGKSETAAFEARNHLTGLYQPWWNGRRFEGPIEAWAAGDTRLTTRNIIQNALVGPHDVVETADWCGMIDPHLIVDVTRASGGIPHCLDTITVQHVERHHGAPCVSKLQLLSYDMGRRVFQGTEKHVIWLDEEPPDGAEAQETQAQGSSDIVSECVLRTMTVNGIVMLTWTPLRGMTPLLKQYLETAVMPGTETDEDVDAKTHFYPDVLDFGKDAA